MQQYCLGNGLAPNPGNNRLLITVGGIVYQCIYDSIGFNELRYISIGGIDPYLMKTETYVYNS